MLNFIMLSVIVLNFITLSVVVLRNQIREMQCSGVSQLGRLNCKSTGRIQNSLFSS
jgi:hypothetical protein